MTDPLVLLPGMNCSERLWEPVASRLRAHGVEVVHASVDADDLDACVDALLASLPARFSLAGVSLGGIVAMAMCRRAPERVTRLALLATNPLAPTDVQRAQWARQVDLLGAGASPRDLQEELLPALLHPRAQRSVVSETLAMADETGRGRLVRQLRLQGTRVDETEGLARLTVPTLILAGADDALCPVSRHELMARTVPDCRLVVLQETGHLSVLERPEEVAVEMIRWWGPVPTPPVRARGADPRTPS